MKKTVEFVGHKPYTVEEFGELFGSLAPDDTIEFSTGGIFTATIEIRDKVEEAEAVDAKIDEALAAEEAAKKAEAEAIAAAAAADEAKKKAEEAAAEIKP